MEWHTHTISTINLAYQLCLHKCLVIKGQLLIISMSLIRFSVNSYYYLYFNYLIIIKIIYIILKIQEKKKEYRFTTPKNNELKKG